MSISFGGNSQKVLASIGVTALATVKAVGIGAAALAAAPYLAGAAAIGAVAYGVHKATEKKAINKGNG